MKVLGLSGGIDTLFSNDFQLWAETLSHDSAAALVIDGKVIAAVEEERLNRIKHTNLFPENAIKYVLQQANITLDDIDVIAIYLNEMFLTAGAVIRQIELGRPQRDMDLRTMIARRLQGFSCHEELHQIAAKLKFYDHHLCHAKSALPYGGAEKSLVFVTDGIGEEVSGLIGCIYPDGEFQMLDVLSRVQSIGIFYLNVTRFLGFSYQDEYKVMGLSSYGDPHKFKPLVQSLYRQNGPHRYEFLSAPEIYSILARHVEPRAKNAEITQTHKDLAASLQLVVEDIILDIVGFWQKETLTDSLIMSGGVAQNSAANGRLLSAGLFDEIFVSPVSHDGGCALGAAILATEDAAVKIPRPIKFNPFLGPDLGDEPEIRSALEKWMPLLEITHSGDIATEVARLLADNCIVGWCQGRAEYGPRALGNRSILADPRPVENRSRINRIVKHREDFRPFAPSVLAEYANEIFEIPETICQLDFMTHVVPVKEPYREWLASVTHADNSARIQTVTREDNPKYWHLIDEFRKQTDCPVLLNTSFNNHAEPIVTTVTDAVVNFLTCDLDVLVVADFIVRKKEIDEHQLLQLSVTIPSYIRLTQSYDEVEKGNMQRKFYLTHKTKYVDYPVSEEIYHLLNQCQAGANPIGSLTGALNSESISILKMLWFERLIEIAPNS
ncbi:carbamoyltransferase family protein [Vibrio mangrovi]|uniref:Carbamoyltransferase C-terminal domain-containing protein n=1 Tax=Vibrio mangrovi TaxID=474394 RepID=A0A1Y6J072_9VIBR|nr:carbamoyltransferase C-terminal domain-containing protein [Vibrio mangrovi]MDW6005418.1 carbamoyltransferase C-terminal domain-containing protein [Vibrio mangrovi]SMS02142.1 Decarbamoylnovobiocin carbamoyltransferase [Vibrio mangrovi]